MKIKFGKMAEKHGYILHLQVLESSNGFYIGTFNAEGPISRESEEYFSSYASAQSALENDEFTQVETLFD
ncbi:hypothetical protein [Neisseria sp. Ec49-e6-T10]|uniref:hypothetical protein n=1 Tax=Neisseria sp. Ec49-e6-T10 TaxID=3140744 RepID=UPI003EBB676A